MSFPPRSSEESTDSDHAAPVQRLDFSEPSHLVTPTKATLDRMADLDLYQSPSPIGRGRPEGKRYDLHGSPYQASRIPHSPSPPRPHPSGPAHAHRPSSLYSSQPRPQPRQLSQTRTHSQISSPYTPPPSTPSQTYPGRNAGRPPAGLRKVPGSAASTGNPAGGTHGGARGQGGGGASVIVAGSEAHVNRMQAAQYRTAPPAPRNPFPFPFPSSLSDPQTGSLQYLSRRDRERERERERASRGQGRATPTPTSQDQMQSPAGMSTGGLSAGGISTLERHRSAQRMDLDTPPSGSRLGSERMDMSIDTADRVEGPFEYTHESPASGILWVAGYGPGSGSGSSSQPRSRLGAGAGESGSRPPSGFAARTTLESGKRVRSTRGSPQVPGAPVKGPPSEEEGLQSPRGYGFTRNRGRGRGGRGRGDGTSGGKGGGSEWKPAWIP